MAKQTINIGTAPNDGTGTPLRTSFDYCNLNFTELYTAVGPSGNNIVVPGSATITGALTVDTSTLVVNAAGYADRVGIGTASPGYLLDAQAATAVAQILSTTGTNAAYLQISNTGGYFYLGRENSAGTTFAAPAYSAVLYAAGAYPLVTTVNGGERYRIASDGVATWSNVGGVAGTAMTLNSTGLGVGGSPLVSHLIHSQGPVGIGGTGSGTRTSYISNASACSIYYTDGGASYPFNEFGNLVIQPRTSASRSVVIATGSTTPVERAVVKSTGQVRFVPLASDPAGAEAGDVYYNSTSNKLKCYNGSTWNDLF
jgi:hypothetical protein